MGLLAASLPLQAAVSQVFSRAALGGSDTLSWGQLGPDSADPLSSVLGATSDASLAATVTNTSGGDLYRFDEGGAVFAGSFAPGDELLSTFDTLTAHWLMVSFTTPVARVGAQIQSMVAAEPFFPAIPFRGWLEAFAGNVSLGSFSILGASDMLQGNTAPFLGIVSTAADISSVRFSVTGTPSPDFAINTLSLSVTPVPEPSAFLMSLAGGAFLLGAMHRRRKATS